MTRKTTNKPRKKKPKTYNYRPLIRSAARKLWMWSPMRKDAIRRVRISPGTVFCEECGLVMKENSKPKEYQVDHVVPASEPSVLIKSWDSFFARLFECPPSGLRVLCLECHSVKTKAENETRE